MRHSKCKVDNIGIAASFAEKVSQDWSMDFVQVCPCVLSFQKLLSHHCCGYFSASVYNVFNQELWGKVLINSTTLEEEFERGSKSAYFALLINVRQLPNETTISVTSHRNKLLFLNRKGVLKEVFLPTMKYWEWKIMRAFSSRPFFSTTVVGVRNCLPFDKLLKSSSPLFSRINVARRLLRGMVKSISRGESLSQLDLLGIVGDAEGHEGKGPKIWPTFGLNYVKSIQFWAMNWQCFGNVFTIVTWLLNWKALTDWPTFWKAKKLHFGQRHLWLISNLLSGKIGYDLFNEKWIVS